MTVRSLINYAVSYEFAPVDRLKVLSVCVWATLAAATCLGVVAAANVVREPEPTSWPPRYAYLTKIPLARDVLGGWRYSAPNTGIGSASE